MIPVMLRSQLTRRCLLSTIFSSREYLTQTYSRVFQCVKCPRHFPLPRSFSATMQRFQHLQHKVAAGENNTKMNLNPDEQAEEILANLDPVRAKKLKVIQLEVSMLQHFGRKVPESFLPSWWLSCLDIETVSGRKKYYRYLLKIENKNKSKERKRAIQAELRAEKEAQNDKNKGTRNTIFMHIRKQTMNESHHYKLAHAMMYGPDLVLDLSFDDMMQKRECINLVEQLWFAYGVNRQNPEPFHLILTGAHPTSQTVQALHRSCRDTSLDKILFTLTEKSYLDLYPKERLVYLTPNAQNELTEFNHDDVYIVGGLVDKSNSKPVTMAKAKEQNIRMAKFPLDKHLIWCQGTKSLTIDQVVQILLDLKTTQSWKSALKHVPKRKILSDYSK